MLWVVGGRALVGVLGLGVFGVSSCVALVIGKFLKVGVPSGPQGHMGIIRGFHGSSTRFK